MTGFADHEPLTYFGEGAAPVLRAVGWLDAALPFAHGAAAESVYRKLIELFRDPFQPFALGGPHECNICQFQAEQRG